MTDAVGGSQHGSTDKKTPSRPVRTRRRFLAGAGALCSTAIVSPSTAAAEPTGRAGSVSATNESEAVEGAISSARSVAKERIEVALEEYDIPGATIAIVMDTDETVTEGYGQVERDTDIPVDSETPFRLGSLSKPVVWTAIGRLIERGLLDPDTEISRYLEMDLLDEYQPITLANLATHTAGFEVSNLEMWFSTPDEVDPLPDHLRRAKPAQVQDPGDVGIYSNYGVALGGQVLASVLDEPFADAMEEVLLSPLGMTTSSFQQPLPDEIDAVHATGHGDDSVDRVAGLGLAPAGSLSATATDMVRFMQLHLNDGVVDGERILDTETIELLQRQWFTHHHRLAGTTFGFIERYHGDVRLLEHTGGTPQFYSKLVLAPEKDIGLCLSFNDASAEDALDSVIDSVLDELISPVEPDLPDPDGDPDRASELEGSYRTLRVPTTTHDRLPMTATATSTDISITDDGALETSLGVGSDRWIEIDSLVFENEETGRRLAFGETDGEITHLFLGGTPSAFASVDVYDSLRLHTAVGLVSLAGILTGHFRWSLTPDTTGETDATEAADETDTPITQQWRSSIQHEPIRLAKPVAYAGCSVLLAFPLISLLFLSMAPWTVLSRPSLLFQLLFVLPLLGAIATALVVGFAVLVWRNDRWALRERLIYSFVTGSLLLAVVFLRYWNLLMPP